MLRADHTYKPTSQAGNDAYLAGYCKVCHVVKHRPGGTECYDCYNTRMDNLGAYILKDENGDYTERCGVGTAQPGS